MIERIHQLLDELNKRGIDGKTMSLIFELITISVAMLRRCTAQNKDQENVSDSRQLDFDLNVEKLLKRKKEPKKEKYIYNTNPRDSSESLESHTRGEGEGLGEGEGKKIIHLATDEKFLMAQFTIFWTVYPRRQAKGGAVRSFRAALKRATADVIIAGARRYAAERNGQDKRYTALATTWLNQDRWLDEPTAGAGVAVAAIGRPKRSWAEIHAERESGNVVKFPGVFAGEMFAAAGGMEPVPMEGSDLDALVCGDDESQKGDSCAEEPRASGLLDILPTLQAMDHTEEN